jgi:cytochrome c553
LLAAIGGSLFVWFGLFDVAASTRHSTPAEWFLHFVMQRSVAHYATELPVPDLDDTALILRGALHYASGCAACHGAPGQLASPIAQQMTPVPPGLYSAARDFDPSQLFWIVRNGVKMTAMPGWPAPGRSDEIWDMVAFIHHLPDLDTDAYAALVGNGPSTTWLPATPPTATADFNPAACAACHSTDGRGRAGAFASIAGLPEPELESALRGYRDGSRPSGFMQPVAAQLTEAQLVAAARYYAALPAGAAK